tara:strand:+ start:64 stop:273 length:210 start_codon:yes stop_codon:yes gene_type:complete
MKVGDYVRIPTGRGRETCRGILLEIKDNPADIVANQTYGLKIRKIVVVCSKSSNITAWADHVEVLSESR